MPARSMSTASSVDAPWVQLQYLCVGCLVFGDDRCGDAAAFVDLNPPALRPRPNIGRVATVARRSCLASPAPCLPRMLDVAVEGPPHLRCVLLRQVDLICAAIDGEADSLVRLRAVEIIHHLDCALWAHLAPPRHRLQSQCKGPDQGAAPEPLPERTLSRPQPPRLSPALQRPSATVLPRAHRLDDHVGAVVG